MPVDLHISDTVLLDISAAGNQVRVKGIVLRLAEWDYVNLTCSLLKITPNCNRNSPKPSPRTPICKMAVGRYTTDRLGGQIPGNYCQRPSSLVTITSLLTKLVLY